MIIRPVVSRDFDALAALVNPHIAGTHVHFGTSLTSGEDMRAEWVPLAARHACLVAELDGECVGFARTHPWRSRAAYAWTAEVGVYVSPNVHRRGVGRALYERLIRVSAEQGYHMLVACIALPNEASVRLHEAVGFRAVGVFPEVGWKLGEYLDVGFWQRALAVADGVMQGPPVAVRTAPGSVSP
jgi:phosphinothricin acetyltransferase